VAAATAVMAPRLIAAAAKNKGKCNIWASCQEKSLTTTICLLSALPMEFGAEPKQVCARRRLNGPFWRLALLAICFLSGPVCAHPSEWVPQRMIIGLHDGWKREREREEEKEEEREGEKERDREIYR
jgi:hypothetical protein